LVLFRSPDEGYCGICRNWLLEGLDVVHLDHGLNREIIRYKLSQTRAVLIAHPSVGNNEPEDPAGSQDAETDFEEANKDVAPPPHRGTGSSISGVPVRRKVLESDIGWISDDKVGFSVSVVSQ